MTDAERLARLIWPDVAAMGDLDSSFVKLAQRAIDAGWHQRDDCATAPIPRKALIQQGFTEAERDALADLIDAADATYAATGGTAIHDALVHLGDALAALDGDA